jgi:hypothetical protein
MFFGFADMASASTAVEHTTITAGGKAFSIAMGIALTAGFLAFSAWTLPLGLRTLRLGRAIEDWPSTPGEIVSSEVGERQGYNAQNNYSFTYYEPKIHYTYAVDGVSYASQRVQAGMEDAHRLALGKAAVSAIVARYPVGATPAVRYDPADPAVSTLEIGQVGGLKQVVAGAGMLVLAVGAAVFTIWSIVTPTE